MSILVTFWWAMLIGKATRLGYVEDALIHAYDHYGQMVGYLSLNGVVPPASRSR